jgi:hypothetical protein
VGATVGVLAPLTLGEYAFGTGPTVGVNAGHRWSFFYLGVEYQHAFLGGGSWEAPSSELYVLTTTWAASDYGGLVATFLTNPTGPIGVSARLGIGDRWLRYSATEGGAESKDLGTTYTDGWDARLALGVPFRVGSLSFVPEVSVGIGALFLYSAAELSVAWEGR